MTETVKALEAGEIDILIGTHAIVGKRIKWKDLGLLIIDEEQKFGVAGQGQAEDAAGDRGHPDADGDTHSADPSVFIDGGPGT